MLYAIWFTHSNKYFHYSDVKMGSIASPVTSLTIVYSSVCSGTDQRKHQSSASLALCAGNSPETGEFPAQRASYAENVSIWWRHHAFTVPHPVRPSLSPSTGQLHQLHRSHSRSSQYRLVWHCGVYLNEIKARQIKSILQILHLSLLILPQEFAIGGQLVIFWRLYYINYFFMFLSICKRLNKM